MVYDWAGLSKNENKAKDEERTRREAPVNRAQRKKERRQKKKRMGEYLERRKAKLVESRAPVVLAPKVLVPPVTVPPVSEGIYSIVPTPTESPTAYLVGSKPVSRPQPWAVGGDYALQLVPDIVGWIMVYAGNKLLASFATYIAGQVTGLFGGDTMGKLQYTVSQPNIHIRMHTGRTGTGTKPGIDSTVPTEPKDNGSEWWEFWNWAS